MAIPTSDDFLACASKWCGQHQGIAYELSWHGKSEYRPEGIWCYYVIVTDEQFYPDDWAELRLSRKDLQFASSWHRHYAYENFPDLDPHGGWTFGEMVSYLGRDGVEHERVKIGCDYGHLWDEEGGFWQGREAVERDAKRSIDLLCEMFPRRRLRCAYCGRYDDREQFYTARNGMMVHRSQIGKFSETEWPMWLPAEDSHD